MASHAHTSSATPGPHTPDNTPTSESHPANLIKKWGTPAILGACALIALFWIGSMANNYRANSEKEAAEAQQRLQASIAQQAQEASRQQHVCGSMNEPACKCQGSDTVMRYLKPGHAAIIAANGRTKFDPSPGHGYKLCNPESQDENGDYTDCVTGQEQNLHVGLTGVAVSTSDKEIALLCEYIH